MRTQRPYAYFERYHDRAPLTSMVQNRVPHCCVMNVTPMVLLWLADVIAQQTPLRTNHWCLLTGSNHGKGFIQVEASSVKGDWGEPVWNAGDAWIEPSAGTVPKGAQNAGWLPSKRFAEAWLAFEKTRTFHNSAGIIPEFRNTSLGRITHAVGDARCITREQKPRHGRGFQHKRS
jgi:hypothetical protein